MSKNAKTKIVVVGQTPPPFNGQAKMIEVMLNGLYKEHDVRFVSMEFSDSVSTAGKFSYRKIFHLFGLIIRTLKSLGIGHERYLYYPPASPNLIPVLRDIFFLLAVRPFCKGLVMHFHAGGVSEYARDHTLLKPAMHMTYGGMLVGIIQGDSCPDDPSYFNAKHRYIVPHGIDVPVLPIQEEVCSSAPIQILYVGIHTEDKGIFTLLETAKVLRERGVEFAIHTVGGWYSKGEEDCFNRRCADYDLEGQVSCIGQKIGDKLWEQYRWADVLFFPTKGETFGIVMLEAMAYSVPVVASRCSGPLDVVRDGETGYLCGVDDHSEFADRIEQLANDVELRNKMGSIGLDRYRSYYMEHHFISRICAVFETLD